MLAVTCAACSIIVGDTPTDTAEGAPSTVTTEAPEENCVLVTADPETVDTGTSASDALLLSGETFRCAREVVVVGESNINEVAAAAQLAAALGGPLLLPHPQLAAEIGRLKPRIVHVLGGVEVHAPPDVNVSPIDITEAVGLAREALGTTEELRLPAMPDASTIIETVHAISAGDRVVFPQTSVTSTTVAPSDIYDPEDVVTGLAVSSSQAESLWMVDAADPIGILLAAAAGASVDAAIVAIDIDDVLGHPVVGDALGGRSPEELRFVGHSAEADQWELAVLANGEQVPGGGFYILPREGKRRYVAFYGHPDTPSLGALGEQGPEETLQRMQPFLDAYTGDGAQVIPTFEMIASVASAGATDDGDYSYEWPIETFRPFLEAAHAHGGYALLDLQPGRDDFLTQAKQYEELLRLPYVGLALDPEWRLKPDQVHLRQIGSVDAAEVNQVIEWLADLVRDNGLPQKMVVLHQFRTSMIQNRETLVDRPELQIVIQMDGDGTEPQKDGTWASIREGAEDAFWSWGWKNFFDEDEPGPPSAENTMAKEPSPVYVSYQ
jgi:hypothetical protein